MAHELLIPKRVQKEIDNIDKKYRLKILAALISIRKDPYSGKKLGGKYKEQRSYEVWPYRIIYEIRKKELIILVVKVRHRQGVY